MTKYRIKKYWFDGAFYYRAQKFVKIIGSFGFWRNIGYPTSEAMTKEYIEKEKLNDKNKNNVEYIEI
jgi:hypothetical protein